MNHTKIHYLYFAMGFLFCFNSISQAASLFQPIDQLSIIVKARVLDYSVDLKHKSEIDELKKNPHAYRGEEAVKMISQIVPRGTYKFQLLKSFVGHCPQVFTVYSPQISYLYSSGKAPISDLGSDVILMLKAGNFDKFEDLGFSDAAIIRLADTNSAVDDEENSDFYDLIIRSFEDERLAPRNSYLMRYTNDEKSLSKMVKYINSSNLVVRDQILFCLAYNKQVAAIPLIAQLVRDMSAYGALPESQILLSRFDGTEALRNLCPLISDSNKFTRINSVDAIRSIIRKAIAKPSHDELNSCIPYLMIGLNDPEKQDVAGTSYMAIQEIIAIDIGNKDIPLFVKNRDSEKQKIVAWWQDELSGKHPADPDEKPFVELRQSQRFEATDLPQLNQGLFMKSEITRRAAMRGLEQFADQSSIPYLLIALYDPQPEIAFNAYTILHRLVPDLGVATVNKWKTEQAMQTKMAFDWWQKYLSDAEKPMGK